MVFTLKTRNSAQEHPKNTPDKLLLFQQSIYPYRIALVRRAAEEVIDFAINSVWVVGMWFTLGWTARWAYERTRSVHVLIDFGIPWQMNPFLRYNQSALLCYVLPTSQPRTDRLNMCKSENPGAISFSFHCAWPEWRKGLTAGRLKATTEQCNVVRRTGPGLEPLHVVPAAPTTWFMRRSSTAHSYSYRCSKMQPKVSLVKASNLER